MLILLRTVVWRTFGPYASTLGAEASSHQWRRALACKDVGLERERSGATAVGAVHALDTYEAAWVALPWCEGLAATLAVFIVWAPKEGGASMAWAVARTNVNVCRQSQ